MRRPFAVDVVWLSQAPAIALRKRASELELKLICPVPPTLVTIRIGSNSDAPPYWQACAPDRERVCSIMAIGDIACSAIQAISKARWIFYLTSCYAGPNGRIRPKAALRRVAIKSLGWRGNDIEPSRRGFNYSPQFVRNACRCHVSGRNGQVNVVVATAARISDPVWVDHKALAHSHER